MRICERPCVAAAPPSANEAPYVSRVVGFQVAATLASSERPLLPVAVLMPAEPASVSLVAGVNGVGRLQHVVLRGGIAVVVRNRFLGTSGVVANCEEVP